MRVRVFFRPAVGEITIALLMTLLAVLALMNDGILPIMR